MAIGVISGSALTSLNVVRQTAGTASSSAGAEDAVGYSGASTFDGPRLTNSVGRPLNPTPVGANLEKKIRQAFEADHRAWEQRVLEHGGHTITLASGKKRAVPPVPTPANFHRAVGPEPRLREYKKGGAQYILKDFHAPRDPANTYAAHVKLPTVGSAQAKVKEAQANWQQGVLPSRRLDVAVRRSFEGIHHDEALDSLLAELGRECAATTPNRAALQNVLAQISAWSG